VEALGDGVEGGHAVTHPHMHLEGEEEEEAFERRCPALASALHHCFNTHVLRVGGVPGLECRWGEGRRVFLLVCGGQASRCQTWCRASISHTSCFILKRHKCGGSALLAWPGRGVSVHIGTAYLTSTCRPNGRWRR
jgi:hypothetical protein